MKKYLVSHTMFGLAVLVLILGCGLFLSACGHKHSFGNWTVVTPATCVTQGLEKRVCKCGETETRKVNATGHSFGQWNITKGATCQSEGTKEHTCSVCLTTESESIAKTNHVPLILVDYKEPSCTEPGHTEKIICAECSTLIQDTETIDMTEHDYGEWIAIEDEMPTCTLEGREKKMCETCGHTEFRTVDRLPHSWGEWTTDDDQPRMHTHKCSVCQFEQSFPCDFTDEQVLNATCTEPGKRYVVCTECETEIVIEKFDPLGHDYRYVEVIVSDEKDAVHKHEHYQHCQRCEDDTEHEACTLTFKENKPATCTTDEYDILKCDKCGSVHEDSLNKAKATGHSFTYESVTFYNPFANGASIHNKVCSLCGETTEERCKIEYNYFPAKCEQNAYHLYECPLCKDSGGRRVITISDSALKHNFTDWQFDGTSKDDAHHWRQCQRWDCGEIEEGDCVFKSSTTVPTCTAAGKVDYVCEYCHEGFSDEGEEATGHKWEEGWKLYTADPTKHYHICSACNQVEYGQHNYDQFEEEAQCEKNKTITSICRECSHTVVTEEEGTARQHSWNISFISETEHIATCSLCQKEVNGAHNWSETNLCAICKHDALTYRTEGEHAVVIKSERVKTAKTKEIIINAKYRKLDSNGKYEEKEYPVTAIENAFQNYDSIVKVTLPDTVTIIKEYSFMDCSSLQEVDCSGDVANIVTIERMAFYYCISLARFNAAQSVKTIGELAFANCVLLDSISIPDDAELDIDLRAFYNTAFVNDSAHWQNDMIYIGKHLLKARQSVQEDGTYADVSFVVKPGTLTIAANAFAECHGLKEITLPSTLQHIDKDAFLNCERLSQVNFNGTVYQWLSITFANDHSSPLYYADTGLHVASVGEDGIVDLTNAEIMGHKITHIPAGTFRNTDLKEIILPNTLTYIGKEAFEGCQLLEKITFKDGCNVSYVGTDVLKDSHYYTMSENWELDEYGEKLVLYIDGKILVEATSALQGAYTIKEGTTVIVARAFAGCNLLTSVKISASMLYVGEYAFDGCTSLNQITFADSSYVWLCYNTVTKISRGHTGDKLNYTTLSQYSGEWRRTYQVLDKQ